MNPWRGLNNIPRSVWLLSFATLINRSGTMVLPYLVLYLTKELKISAGLAGLVLAAYGAGAFITAPFVGKLSDRIGSLKVMRISLFTTGMIIFLYSFVKSYYLIIAVTLIWSVISEAFRPANLSFISMETPPAQRKTAFALNRLAINLGMSIGPVVGGFLIALDFSLLFYVNGMTTILAAVFLTVSTYKHAQSSEQEIVLEDPDKTNTGQPEVGIDKKTMSIFKDRKFILFSLALIPVELVYFQLLGGMPLHIVRDLKFAESTFGILIAINTVLIIFVEVPLNNWMAHWDDRKALALGAILTGIGFGAMVFSSNLIFIAFTIIIWTFGEMIFFPASASYTAILSPGKRRGEYMGYFQMTFSLAFMLGPWMGVVVLDGLGSTALWIGSFILSILSTIAFLHLKNTMQYRS